MGGEGNPIGDAMNMAATGVGLGIMTMGAMVPITIMKKMAEDGTTVKNNKQKKINIKMPKMNIKFKTPKAVVKKVKVK